MSRQEAEVWEQVAQKCREGISPSMAAKALGKWSAWRWIKSKGHPAAEMVQQAWAEGIAKTLSHIRASDSWQAQAWMLERQEPMEYAVDGSIRRTIVSWAQESGLDVATLNDLIRVLKTCRDMEIDLAELVEEEVKRRDSNVHLL